MSFSVGIKADGTPKEWAVRGRYRKVAVDCWFTASGRTIPRMIKYEDEGKELHLIRDLQVLRGDQRNYAGITAQRYDCRAEVEGRPCEFTLLYHPGENTWDLVIDK